MYTPLVRKLRGVSVSTLPTLQLLSREISVLTLAMPMGDAVSEVAGAIVDIGELVVDDIRRDEGVWSSK